MHPDGSLVMRHYGDLIEFNGNAYENLSRLKVGMAQQWKMEYLGSKVLKCAIHSCYARRSRPAYCHLLSNSRQKAVW